MPDQNNIDTINSLLRDHVDISADQARYAMSEILNGRLSDEQLGDFITLLHAKGETPLELASLVNEMWENSPHVDVDASSSLDTCGTGGDQSNTFNISTAVALVLAAAGVPIAKHGNRAASSKCGAADVLEALNIPVSYTPDQAGQLFKETGFTFLFAPTFHPGMRFAGPVRKALGVPTTFNYLGPLANPFHAPYRIHGISQERLLLTYAQTLRELGVRRAYVFHGHGGLDEISLSGVTNGYLVDEGNITEKKCDPHAWGFTPSGVEELAGGDAHRNAQIIMSVLEGEQGAPYDIVVLNASVAYDVVHQVGIEAALEVIRETIASGAAQEKVREVSQRATALCG